MSETNYYPGGMKANHPYFALSPQIARLLWTSTLPAGTYLSGTVVLTAPSGESRKSIGSGFVVQVGDQPPGEPDFFLVTARHNVRPVTIGGDTVSALIVRGYDPLKPVQDRVPIELPNERWIYSDDSDVAIIPLPIDTLPLDHNVVAIPHTLLASRRQPVVLQEGAELKAFGSWRVSPSGAIPIARTLYLATFERPTAGIEFDGARKPMEVFIAEGTVSRGMSGGPVTVPGGWGDSALIGLIHGFAPLSAEDVANSETEAADDTRAMVLRELGREIGEVNSRIVMVIPEWEIEKLLQQVGF